MAELLMIVPTRGRPHAIPALWEAWAVAATGAADLLFAIDDDDPCHDAYVAAVEPLAAHGVLLRSGPRLRLVGTLNAAALDYADRYRCLGLGPGRIPGAA